MEKVIISTEKWAENYFKNRGIIPSSNQYMQIYDAALGYFLKIEFSDH